MLNFIFHLYRKQQSTRTLQHSYVATINYKTGNKYKVLKIVLLKYNYSHNFDNMDSLFYIL